MPSPSFPIFNARRRLAVLAWLIAAVSTSLVAQAAPDCERPAARIVSIEGPVEVSRAGHGPWQSAVLDQPLCPGDLVAVRRHGRAAVVFEGEVLSRLDQFSTLEVAAKPADGDAAVGLREGIAHFISRLRKRVEVITPVVNALVEGTEFTVLVRDGRGHVVVAEGRVRASTAAGEQRLLAGEAAEASAGGAPRRIEIDPLDAVRWAIHYPVVMWPAAAPATSRALAARGRYAEALAQAADAPAAWRANLLLALGRGEEAAPLLDDSTAALAVRTIAAVARQDADEAAALAAQAIAREPAEPAAQLAHSYVLQAAGRLEAALAAAQRATELAPDNPVAWARRAELALSLSRIAAGREAARRALAIDAGTVRAQAMDGFARLLAGDAAGAEATLAAAIAADSADPLARYAHGMALVRQGRVAEGRRELELAVLLDPSNAEYRATLGRAYMAEGRDKRAEDQLALASRVDPASPSPWFFSAQRRLQAGDVLGAIDDGNTALALNDNRLTLRSPALLATDRAARGITLGSAYHDAGFDHALKRVASDALAADPVSGSAHQLMALGYSDDLRLESARVSEQFQSFVYGDIGQRPVAPQDLVPALPILTGARLLSLDETAGLFDRSPHYFSATALAGTQESWGTSVVGSVSGERAQASVGHFEYRSDGFAPDADVDISSTRAEFRARATEDLLFFADLQHTDSATRDITQSFFTNLDSASNRERGDLVHAGVRTDLSPNATVVAYAGSESGRGKTVELTSLSPSGIIVSGELQRDEMTDFSRREWGLRLDGATQVARYAVGAARYRGKEVSDEATETTTTFAIPLPFPFPPIVTTIDDVVPSRIRLDSDQSKIFGRVTLLPTSWMSLEGAFDYVRFEAETDKQVGGAFPFSQSLPRPTADRVSPSLGVIVRLAQTTLRAAVLQGVSLSALSGQRIEPTRLAGFDLVHDDPAGTRFRRVALGAERELGPRARIGGEWSLRKLDVPNVLCGVDCLDRWDERRHFVYASTSLSDHVGAEIGWRYESLGMNDAPLGGGLYRPIHLRMETLPIRLFVQMPSRMNLMLEALRVRQDVINLSPPTTERFNASAWMLNARVRWHVPGQRWRLGLDVRNVFDQRALVQNTDLLTEDPRTPLWYPERAAYLSAQVAF